VFDLCQQFKINNMKQVITTERIPIKLWLDDMEPGAIAQAKNLANLPFDIL